MGYTKFYTLLLIFSLALSSCGDKKTENQDDASKAIHSAEMNYVDTMKLSKVPFDKQIITNGKLRATKKSELRFLTSGTIEEIKVRNGESVGKGSVIARLNNDGYKIRLNQAVHALEKAEIEMLDLLVGYGYESDTTSAPKNILNIAKIRSGFTSAQHSHSLAKMDLANTELIAPFAGVVANITQKEFEQTGDIFCTVIDNNNFDVEFNLLESELRFLEKGQSVRVISYVDATISYTGQVTEINPMIDKNGQINVRARIRNHDKKLIEGMNVKIYLDKPMGNQLVVPKSAVVIRDNQTVLFRYNPTTKKAMWTYVDVIMSNSNSHVVAPTEKKNAVLNIGDIIITSGNLNLGDASNVELK